MIKVPRGTQDILPADSELWSWIEETATKIFKQSGFKEIRTPIFEASELFNRAVGESSDIVNKEMYSFNDRSDRSLTLRPEATACIVRSFIEHHMDRNPKPQKLWYRGPMFRYERPQTGRYRQFHQIGAEAIGSKPPYIDLEIISLGVKLIRELGVNDFKLHINSLGNENSRNNYTKALIEFINQHKDKVCEDCQRRLEQNPLRCLDCKVPEDQEIYKNAPEIAEYLDQESQDIWQSIQDGLKELDIDFVIDKNLVRGLDYYSHAVFEIKSLNSNLGAQNTLLAGGRYDKLVSDLGGPSNPAVGWGMGIERIMLLLQSKNFEQNKIFVISDDGLAAQKLVLDLRTSLPNSVIDYDYQQAKFKKQLEKAIKQNYNWAVFWLSEERERKLFKVKDLKNSVEHKDLNLEKMRCILYQT